MPFGQTSAPAVFQHMMNDIFQEYLDQFMVAHLDEILIYSPDLDTHEQHVHPVLSRSLRQIWKVRVWSGFVEFMGCILSPDGISMDQGKVAAIHEWKPLTR